MIIDISCNLAGCRTPVHGILLCKVRLKITCLGAGAPLDESFTSISGFCFLAIFKTLKGSVFKMRYYLSNTYS